MTNKQPRFAFLPLALLLTTLAHPSACADIVAVTGDIQITAPPASVGIGVIESSTSGIVFQERSGYQLLADTRVSIPGAVGTYDENADMDPMDLPAGLTVNSYLMHFDPNFGAPRFQGTVEFADPIVGVMLLPFALNNSDAELAAPGTVYPTSASSRRGLDFDDFTILDSLEVLSDRSIRFDFSTSNAVDQIRIVTSAIPEPASASMCCLVTLIVIWRWTRLQSYRRRIQSFRQATPHTTVTDTGETVVPAWLRFRRTCPRCPGR
ncbi:hypothetical protein Fuma_04828 [Fuerstiella marisgermanici]|uniref:PEP-CTERM sorting domain-containing protein n=1 Tax=Fuerstiella marisgermanici TaxID=1891926 RepID=A0A1P8WM78_9PLAN|nr:hypothetical protein Fuma_04828 [Fuerstiella marisgermanici]